MKHLLPAILFATKLFAFEVGDVVPCVVLEGYASDGKAVTRCIRDRESKTQNYTIVDFALTTCEACTESIPQLSWLSDCLTSHATTRVVYVDSSKDDVMAFLTTHKEEIKFATAMDTAQKAMKAWKVSVLPATFILNKKNEIVFKHEGVVTEEVKNEIEKMVTKADF